MNSIVALNLVRNTNTNAMNRRTNSVRRESETNTTDGWLAVSKCVAGYIKNALTRVIPRHTI